MATEHRNRLIELFMLADKKTVRKFCRDTVVTKEELSSVIWAGKTDALSPYKYACHFDQLVPEHLLPTEDDRIPLSSGDEGKMIPGAAKMIRKVSQIFRDRRVFAGHLFYLPSREIWHLIYFDQRDMSQRGNHWKGGGSHIHYSRESFVNTDLDTVWGQICARPPSPPPSVHIRFLEEGQRGFVGPVGSNFIPDPK